MNDFVDNFDVSMLSSTPVINMVAKLKDWTRTGPEFDQNSPTDCPGRPFFDTIIVKLLTVYG